MSNSKQFDGEAREYFAFRERFRNACAIAVTKDIFDPRYANPMPMAGAIAGKMARQEELTAAETTQFKEINKYNEEVEAAAMKAKGILRSMVGPTVNAALEGYFQTATTKRNQVVNAVTFLENRYGTPHVSVGQGIIAELHNLAPAPGAADAMRLVAEMQMKFAELANFPATQQESHHQSIGRLAQKLGEVFASTKKEFDMKLADQTITYTREMAFDAVIRDARYMTPSPATVPAATQSGSAGAASYGQPSAQPSGQPSAQGYGQSSSAPVTPSFGAAEAGYRAAATRTPEEDAAFLRGYNKRLREEAEANYQTPVKRPQPQFQYQQQSEPQYRHYGPSGTQGVRPQGSYRGGPSPSSQQRSSQYRQESGGRYAPMGSSGAFTPSPRAPEGFRPRGAIPPRGRGQPPSQAEQNRQQSYIAYEQLQEEYGGYDEGPEEEPEPPEDAEELG